MGRISDLRRKAQRETSVVYDTLFTRRVSIYVTAALAPLGVRANHVSAANVAVGLAACALLAFAGPFTFVLLGVLLLHLCAVLDSVDGELARLRRDFSLTGLFLEDWSAYTMINAFNLAIAWYLRRTGWGNGPLLLAVVVVAFGRNVMPVVRRALIKSVLTRRAATPFGAGARNRPETPQRALAGFGHFVSEHVLHCTNVWFVLSTLVLLEVGAGWSRVGLVLAAFCAYNGLFLLREMAGLWRCLAGDTLDRQLEELYAAGTEIPDAQQAVDPRRLAEFEPWV